VHPAAIDETGKTYGRLTVLGRAPRGDRKHTAAYWHCRCECGQQTNTSGHSLRDGTSRSCGCGNTDAIKRSLTKDETGKRYGRWTVLERQDNRGVGVRWLCRCDCGTEKVVDGKSLRFRQSQSCGCYQAEVCAERFSLPEGRSMRNTVLRVAKRTARIRGYAWRLTDEHALSLCEQDCHYCGAPPSNLKRHPDANGSFTYSGIDRVDNDRGYEPDNVVPCCKHCNVAKRDRSLSDFLAWVARVNAHSIAQKVEQ
jgi:hypothetical protein